LAELDQIAGQHKDFDAVLVDGDMAAADGGSLAEYIRTLFGNPDVPIFRLFEMPPQAVLSVPGEDRTTCNLSKLDRQGLLGAIASVLAAKDEQNTSQELAA
jgi:CheY-like chemotaxis protein